MALVGVAGTQQRRRAGAQPGFDKGLREVLYERAELQPTADRPERESACELGRQAGAWTPASGATASCEPRVEVRIAAPGATAGGKGSMPCEYEPVPPCDPREPVLYVRCSGSSDKALGGDAANGSWSPKIGAVMRTSLEGGERWARLQLSKLGVNSPRSPACGCKED